MTNPYEPFTPAEMNYVYLVAREGVKLKHPIFTHVELDWEVDRRRWQLEVVVRAKVPNRDAPSRDAPSPSIFDEPRPSFEDSVNALESIVRHGRIPESMFLIPVVATFPIYFADRSLLAIDRRDDLIRYLAAKARSALRNMVSHEVDEMLMVEGERIFDPHADEAPRTLPGAIHKLTVKGKVTV